MLGNWGGINSKLQWEAEGGNVKNYSKMGRRCQSKTCIALITSFLNPKAEDELCLNTVPMGEGVTGGWVLPVPPEQW